MILRSCQWNGKPVRQDRLLLPWTGHGPGGKPFQELVFPFSVLERQTFASELSWVRKKSGFLMPACQSHIQNVIFINGIFCQRAHALEGQWSKLASTYRNQDWHCLVPLLSCYPQMSPTLPHMPTIARWFCGTICINQSNKVLFLMTNQKSASTIWESHDFELYLAGRFCF